MKLRVMIDFYRERARELRKNSTIAEKRVWSWLRSRQLGCRFLRQYVFDDKYIVDFICIEKRLIIEIDGGQHCDSKDDKRRDDYLRQRGFGVLRLWNNEVMLNPEGCKEAIIEKLGVL